jgi:hypothetical protein
MSMTKKMMVVTGLCVAVCLLLSSVAYSEAPKPAPAPAPAPAQPKEVKLEGTVSVVKDANNVITAVKLITARSTYDVVLNKKGLELGNTMADKKVEVEGTVSHKDGQKWIDVKSFKLAEEKPAEKPKEKE